MRTPRTTDIAKRDGRDLITVHRPAASLSHLLEAPESLPNDPSVASSSHDAQDRATAQQAGDGSVTIHAAALHSLLFEDDLPLLDHVHDKEPVGSSLVLHESDRSHSRHVSTPMSRTEQPHRAPLGAFLHSLPEHKTRDSQGFKGGSSSLRPLSRDRPTPTQDWSSVPGSSSKHSMSSVAAQTRDRAAELDEYLRNRTETSEQQILHTLALRTEQQMNRTSFRT